MKISEYVEACTDFAQETKNWGALDPYKFYTTNGDGQKVATTAAAELT